MDDKYKAYLLSDEWAQLKIDLFNERGKQCEKCNSSSNIAVHHLHYDNIYNEEPEDLIILCGYHHAKVHGKLPKVKKRKKKTKHKPTKRNKSKVKRFKKPKQTISFVKDGNTTMVITRSQILTNK